MFKSKKTKTFLQKAKARIAEATSIEELGTILITAYDDNQMSEIVMKELDNLVSSKATKLRREEDPEITVVGVLV